MRVGPASAVERLLNAATAATRCRQAAAEESDVATVTALMRAAQRYSERVAAIADELAAEGRV